MKNAENNYRNVDPLSENIETVCIYSIPCTGVKTGRGDPRSDEGTKGQKDQLLGQGNCNTTVK
jgi:hypothetical protein